MKRIETMIHKIFLKSIASLITAFSISGCALSQSPYNAFKSEAQEIQVAPWYLGEGSPCNIMIKSIERVIVNMADVASGKSDPNTVIPSLKANPVLFNPLLTYNIDDEFTRLVEQINRLEGAMGLEIEASSDFTELAETYLEEYESLKLNCSGGF